MKPEGVNKRPTTIDASGNVTRWTIRTWIGGRPCDLFGLDQDRVRWAEGAILAGTFRVKLEAIYDWDGWLETPTGCRYLFFWGDV
jgi:hypothetical protein